ncbi:DUF58 domain-containing protein [Priestia abyssalis]|uniref:DUF58 domain-containing protein n=1 Tax=Priestia abyssalis TaxID=1221450 RepID=UPI000995096E|nr:DUF58 domain-containing protein [Priestia abyssalis]
MAQLKRIMIQIAPIIMILFFFTLTFVYAMFQGGFVSWFLFYSFAPFGFYSVAVMVYPLHRLEVNRKLNKRVYQKGDEFTATITITRKGYFPLLYMIIQDELPLHLENHYGKTTSKIMVFPFFRKKIQIQYSLFALPRGEHLFKGVRLKTGDFFGLVTKEAYNQKEEIYLVYPKVTEVELPALFTEYEQGEQASGSVLHHGGGIVSGIREYQAGDRFSWIDWKASARKNALVSKEFEQQTTNRLTVVMDASTRYGLESRITFAASILSGYVKAEREIQFISLGEKIYIQPLQNPLSHLREVLYHLTIMQGEAISRFPEMLHQEWSKWPLEGSALLIVTEMNKPFMFTVEAMIERGCHVFIVMVIQRQQSLNEKERMFVKLLNSKQIQVKIITESELFDTIH